MANLPNSTVVAIAVGAAYAVGSIPWGLLIGKFNGIDLRKYGSGNIGATNVTRTLGKDWGILCFTLDFLKGLAPVLLAAKLAQDRTGLGASLLPVLAAAGAFAGHVWPFTLKFKGGKGVATTIGALLALAPVSLVVGILAWAAIYYSSGYVSLASMLAAMTLPVAGLIERSVRGNAPPTPVLVLLAVLAALIVYRHRSNIQRLRQGTEHCFKRKKPEEES